PGQRTPLWMQRQRSADLLSVASQFGSFPIVLETYREVLRDVFDVPALKELLARIRSRAVRVLSVETRVPSPFASSLLFDYVATFMYEGDAPMAERRAQALALDRDLLAELLGTEELRELLDPAAVAGLELELQSLAGARRPRSVDGVHDLLRRLGDLRGDEVAARCAESLDVAAALSELEGARRAMRMRIAGEERWVAIEDVARYRDALGASPPPGVAETWLEAAERPLDGLLLRWARTHAPFTAEAPAARWGIGAAGVEDRLGELVAHGALLEGAFRPRGAAGGAAHEYTDPDVLRALRRRSLARLRREVEPVEPEAFARFLPAWHGIGSGATGVGRLLEVVAQLEGVPMPASTLERDVLRARIRAYSPRLLDELAAAGEVVWVGRGAVGRDDGRVAFYRRDRVEYLAVAGGEREPPSGPLHDAIRAQLQRRGATFFPQLRAAVPDARRDDELLDALWDLVWAGEVTNDSFGPLRALGLPRSRSRAAPRPGRLLALGPPRAQGRWSLVADLVGEGRGATERAHALATALLERAGVVTREGVIAEGVSGGYAAVYPVLRAMEEAGRVRRGYFVAGLGAAQFALPGAVERLRAARGVDERPATAVVAAADPAQPYGAALPWPRGADDDRLPLQRAAGAYAVLVDGAPALYLERGGRSLFTLPAASDPGVADAAVAALASLLAPAGPWRELRLERVDRLPPRESALAERLTAAGFGPSYRGWLLRTT
ncbi:MAG: Lhr family helicase, partial [Candidatus Limnocylindria bacterium]